MSGVIRQAVGNECPSRTELVRVGGDVPWAGWRVGGLVAAVRKGAQSGQGAIELILPGPALGQVKIQAAGRAGEPSGQGEETPPQGLGGHYRLAQTDASCPAGQVVRHDPVSSTGQALDGQPGPLRQAQDWRGNGPRGVIEPDAVLQVADGILDLGVAAMVGLQCQGCPVPVGDAAVIAVVDEQRQLGAGRGLDPAYDEPHGCGVGLLSKGTYVVSATSAAPSIQ